jgi:hypothetical protein
MSVNDTGSVNVQIYGNTVLIINETWAGDWIDSAAYIGIFTSGDTGDGDTKMKGYLHSCIFLDTFETSFAAYKSHSAGT